MSDTGGASAGGGSSDLSGLNLDQTFNDASLGDALSGGSGNLFGDGAGGGSPDISSLFADAGLGSALLGDSSGLGGVFSTVDPSGTQAATQSMTPAADVAGTPSGSDPSANIGGTQSGGAPQPTTQNQQQQTTPAAAKQPPSPLAQIAKALGGAFGLGAKPTAGGPTAPTPASSGADQRGAGGILSQLLPTMPTPANTGVLPPGGYTAPQSGIGSDAAAAASQTDDPAAKAAAEGGPADQATPQVALGGGPGNALEVPTGTPAQPPAAVAKPAATPTPAPAAPAPAVADLPTKKGPETPATPEAPPGAPQGVPGPTEGMGEILRDILGLALGSPTLLPMLAQMIGGRGHGRGGLPPWAMHGMMPFMRGTRRGFVGFRGGFLRPGYYPRRQGGWGFHPGGYHPGWGAWAPGQAGNQPMAFAGGGGSSGGGGASGGWGAPTSDGSPPNGGQAGDAAAQPGGATSPVDGVPADVLNEARQVALQTGGDPNAVADFMRKEGYPEHAGEWCGDFAAAVVKASGGTPPAGSAMAGSWAGYGAARQGAPQQGDIAVIRGQDNKTGMPYTHVTFVDRVNPDGTFVGLGGNQGGGQLKRSIFPISSAVFRVPPPSDAIAAAPATATAPSTPAATPASAPTPAPAQPTTPPVQSDDYAATG